MSSAACVSSSSGLMIRLASTQVTAAPISATSTPSGSMLATNVLAGASEIDRGMLTHISHGVPWIATAVPS